MLDLGVAASAWASRSGGRWGASAVSASAREVVAGEGGGGGQRLGQDGGLLSCGQVGRQPGQRLGAGGVAGDGSGGGQRLGQQVRWQVGRQRGQRLGAVVVAGDGGGGGQRLGQQAGAGRGRWVPARSAPGRGHSRW